MLIDIDQLITVRFWKMPSYGRRALSVVSALSISVLAGCAVHPVQQDVTRVPTKEIVRRIRCEARLSVLDKAIDMLRASTDPTERSKRIADRLAAQRGEAIIFNPLTLKRDEDRVFYNTYINTVIAYDFLFDTSEGNKFSVAADPIRLITNGVAGAALNASSDFGRSNLRHFEMSDTFGDLLANKDLVCDKEYQPENPAYPIAGNVGLRNLIETFIDLNEDKQLGRFGEANAERVFADTIKFTTTLSGGIGPHAQIDAVGSAWGLASPTNLGLSASRTDIHTLTIGLAMGAAGRVPLSSSRIRLFSRDSLSGRSRVNSSVITNKDRAFKAIDDLRYRNFLDRAGTLITR